MAGLSKSIVKMESLMKTESLPNKVLKKDFKIVLKIGPFNLDQKHSFFLFSTQLYSCMSSRVDKRKEGEQCCCPGQRNGVH